MRRNNGGFSCASDSFGSSFSSYSSAFSLMPSINLGHFVELLKGIHFQCLISAKNMKPEILLFFFPLRNRKMVKILCSCRLVSNNLSWATSGWVSSLPSVLVHTAVCNDSCEMGIGT